MTAPLRDAAIVIVDPDTSSAHYLAYVLRQHGHCVVRSFADAGRALHELARRPADMVLAARDLAGTSCAAFIAGVRSATPATPVVVTTIDPTVGTTSPAPAGANGLLHMPPTIHDVLASVEDALERSRANARDTRVLAVGAHAGDVLVGSGATLLAHTAAGHHVDVVTMTGEEVADTYAQHDIGLTTGGFLPCTIPGEGASVEFLAHIVAVTAPDVIYVNSANDRDADHRNTHRALLAAAALVPAVYGYELPATSAGFEPAHYVDAEVHMAGKLSLLATGARTACAHVHPHALLRTTRHWARSANATAAHAEAFEIAHDAPATRPRVTAEAGSLVAAHA